MSEELLETQIGAWRAAVLRGRAVADADELEGHLRDQISDLEAAGLTGDEAFLIAVRRLGQVDLITAGIGRDFDRDLLTVFDVLLLVVLGLVVYGISARELTKGARAMDVIRLVAVVAAVMLDILVLVSMFARVSEFGLTANRMAALGLNIILLVNLAVTASLIGRLLAGRAPAVRLERWQTGYLPVFAGWVALVVLALPPLFAFA